MTEELKQKAEEWCLNHTFADTDSAEGIRLQNAYIAGAEPREKRIADLEKKNAELKNRNAELKGMYAHSAREAGTYKQFFEQKEKENAELKEKFLTIKSDDVRKSKLNECKTYEDKIEYLRQVSNYALFNDDISVMLWCFCQRGEIDKDQLTKVKELLKQWLQTSKASGCDNINIATETEQFLAGDV